MRRGRMIQVVTTLAISRAIGHLSSRVAAVRASTMNDHLASAARRALPKALLFAAIGCLWQSEVAAQTVLHTVSTSTDFVNAIADINADPTSDHRIEIVGTITMSEQVQAIEISGALTVV